MFVLRIILNTHTHTYVYTVRKMQLFMNFKQCCVCMYCLNVFVISKIRCVRERTFTFLVEKNEVDLMSIVLSVSLSVRDVIKRYVVNTPELLRCVCIS